MRTTAVTLNALATLFFASFLAYTFFARTHLDGLAREFVTEKTLEYSDPLVDLAEASLDAPFVQDLLTPDMQALARDEIAGYRADPAAWIADLTRLDRLPEQPPNGNPLLEKVASFKEDVRLYYDNTLTALIEDLRIFSLSNLVAALLALALAVFSRGRTRQPVVWFSILMFAAVLCSSWLYVDDLTFFRILFRAHLGWWYPVSLGVMATALHLDFGRLVRKRPQSDPLVARPGT